MVLALGPIIVGFALAVLFTVFMAAEVGVRLLAGAGRLGRTVIHR